MTTARLDSDIRIYDFVKLAILLTLATLFGLIAYSGLRDLQPTLANTSMEVVAGEALTLQGQGEAGRIVVVQAGEIELGRTTVDDAGEWLLEAEAPATPALYTILLQNEASAQNEAYAGALRVLDPAQAMATEEALTVVDSAENAEEASAIETIIAEVEIPPFEISPDLSAQPLILADGSADLNGFAAPNSTIAVVLDGEVVQSFSADADGSWTETILIEEAGAHSLRFVATDENGTVTETEAVEFVRYTAPTIEFSPASEENPAQVTLNGVAEGDAKVGIEVNGTLIDITRADMDGAWLWVGQLPEDAGNEFALRAILLDDDNAPLVAGATMEVALPELDVVDVVIEEAVDGEGEAAGATETAVDEAAADEQAADEEAAAEEVAVEAVPAEGLAALKLPDALASEGRFNTLFAALDLTGNIYTLKLDEPFSIFAPTDAAFGRLPARVLEGWQNDFDALRAVLLHHLVPGEIYADDLPVRGTITSAANTQLAITDTAGVLGVEGVPIDKADTVVANGVIHEIGTVLLPPSDFAETRIDASGVSTFKGSDLTITGNAQAGAAIIVELNGEPFGVAKAADDGFWSVPGAVTPGNYIILAYALNDGDILQNMSEPVLLVVEE